MARSPQADPGSSSGGTTWRAACHGPQCHPQCHPQAWMSLAGKVTAQPLGLVLQIPVLCSTPVPMLWVLEQPRSLSQTLGEAVTPINPSWVSLCVSGTFPILPGAGSSAGQGRAPTASLPRHQREWEGWWLWAKLGKAGGSQYFWRFFGSPILPNTQGPRRARRPRRGRKESWSPQGCAAAARPAGEGWREWPDPGDEVPTEDNPVLIFEPFHPRQGIPRTQQFKGGSAAVVGPRNLSGASWEVSLG